MIFKTHTNETLVGSLVVSRKIDGVRVHQTTDGMQSRNGKPLYNIPIFKGEIAEVFCGSFEETITATRTIDNPGAVKKSDIYHLYPKLDPRLFISRVKQLTPDDINNHMRQALIDGFEGLVIHNLEDDIRWKKKPILTADVRVTGTTKRLGKHAGMIGALVTNYGKVGAGLTLDVVTMHPSILIGSIIEVEFMGLTDNNKFRHPRFKRLRPDKQTESLI